MYIRLRSREITTPRNYMYEYELVPGSATPSGDLVSMMTRKFDKVQFE